LSGQNKFLLSCQNRFSEVTEVSLDWPNFFSTDQSNLHVRSISRVVTCLSIDWPKKYFFHQSILVFVFFGGFLFWVVLVGEFLVQSVDRLFWVCFGLVLWVFCVFVVWFELVFLLLQRTRDCIWSI